MCSDRDHPGGDGPERLLTVDEVACWLGKPKATLYVWRTRGHGPRGIKVGNALRYRRRDVEAWLDQQAEQLETSFRAAGEAAAPRPRLRIGPSGRLRRELAGPRSFRAGCRFRDHNGPARDVESWGDTDAAARTQLVILRDRATQTSDEITGDTHIGTLGERWLQAILADADVAPQTIDRYEASLRTAIVPDLGNLRVRELTVGRLERFFRSLRDRPGKARGAKTVLGRMLAMAVRHGALAHNPIRELERKRRPRRGARALTMDDLYEVRAAIHRWQHPPVRRPGPRHTRDLADIVDMLLATGARISEVLALRWCDLEVAATPVTVTISGTLVYVKGRGFFRQEWPKTAAGYRTLTLPGFAVDILRRRQVTAGGSPPEALFCSRRGSWLSPHNVRRQWRQAREATGLEWVTPHTFRKTVATLIEREADLKTAAAQLGHASEARHRPVLHRQT